jgi:murein DD-endopeptidase MepM/ murein hydrolase activator NlpD
MTSAVGQYNGSGDIEDGANYSNTLATQFILQGGILDPNKNLRSGLGIDGAYSNISPIGVEYRLGIRPMPGITSVDVKTKSAYGSLREAVVNFNCWDIHQLEELELLYMRPGYSVMLEWGWSPYLKNDGTLETNVQFLDDVLNAQNGTPSKEDVWEKAFNKSSDINEGGNYEALYGFVKNYSWKARMDGGYDCTTTIISIGEILESLKINYGAFKADVGKYGTFKDPNMSTPFKEESNLGKSYTKNVLAGIINELYLIAQGNFGGSYNSGGTFELSDITEATVNVVKTLEAPVINLLTAVYQAATGQEVTAYDPKTESKSIEIDGETYDFFAFEVEVENPDDKIKDSDFTAGNYQIYITLEGFIKILNKYVTIHDSQNKTPIVEISLTEGKHMENPGASLLCLGDKLQMSTNPSVCLIKNTAWSNPTDLGLEDGFFTDFTTFKKIIKHLDKNYWYNEDYTTQQLGVIGNIYVNLAYLYSLVVNEDLSSKDKKEKNDISVFDYLKNVMAGINTSIGNVATFDISIDSQDSKARIIDVNYVDSTKRDVAYENAAIIEMQNLISTVRSYSFESQIFPEQSTMVAIGAQVKGGAIGENTETLIDFNQKLVDRVIPKKDAPLPQNPPEDPELKRKEELKNLKTNLEILTKYINKLDPSWIESTGEFDTNEAGKYSNALKDIINYFKSLLKDDNKNRAIIPTKLSIEMDGISGMIIGNLFRIREELMPRGYKGDGAGPAKIGYVVTRLGHSISNNDWKTKIEAQFIIFDEPRGEGSYLSLTDIKTINESALNTDTSSSGSLSSASKLVTKIILTNKSGGARGLNPTSGLSHSEDISISKLDVSQFIYPVDAIVTSAFKVRQPIPGGVPGSEFHRAIDLGCPAGTPVYSVCDGVVTRAGAVTGYGNNAVYIKVDPKYHPGDPGPYYFIYGHGQKMYVKVGDKVTTGQQITDAGNQGLPGQKMGSHLHLQLRRSDAGRDSSTTSLLFAQYFPPEGGSIKAGTKWI